MPSIEGGGVEKNLFLVSDYLSNKINKVYLITASKKYKKKFNKKIKLILPKFNFWDNLGRKMKYLICLLLLFKQIMRDKNLLILCFQANIYCIILCKIFNRKIIVRSNSSPSGWSNNFVKNILFKFILKKADQILVNSFEFKKQLKKKFGVNAVCIYNPLNKKEIVKKSKTKSLKIFSNKNKLKIINVGRFVDQKDQLTMLRALNLLSKKTDFEAVLVGSGILKESLIDYVKKNKINNKVKFINYSTNPYPLINQSDLFILSSKYEGLPNVLLEALTLKKFIISSDCPTGPKEILLGGKGGLLFKVGNYSELQRKISYYLNNKKICKSMLNSALNQLGRFDYNLNLKKYLFTVKKFI
jgi:glycosyltransferase involved in cell wall biosynthesis